MWCRPGDEVADPVEWAACSGAVGLAEETERAADPGEWAAYRGVGVGAPERPAGRGVASRRLVPIGACRGVVKSSRNSRSAALEELVGTLAKGNELSSNKRCLEMMTLFVAGSKH